MEKLVIKILTATVIIKSHDAHSRAMVLLRPRLDRDISGGLFSHVLFCADREYSSLSWEVQALTPWLSCVKKVSLGLSWQDPVQEKQQSRFVKQHVDYAVICRQKALIVWLFLCTHTAHSLIWVNVKNNKMFSLVLWLKHKQTPTLCLASMTTLEH